MTLLKQPRWRRAFLALLLLASLLTNSGCTKELKKARHLSRGDKAFKEQKFDEAEIEYLKVLQAVPLEPNAFRQLGLIYQQEGKVIHAGQFLIKAAAFEPTNAEVQLKLALCELDSGANSNAVQRALKVLKLQPGQADALEIYAGASISTNGLPDIQNEIEKLRQGDKERASYHVAFAMLQLREQNITNAEVEFKKALELDPKSASALIGLGRIYWARDDLAGAEQAFKSAADLSPVRSPGRLKYADFKNGTKHPEEARKYVEQMTKEAPDYLPAWNFLAQIAFQEKRYDDCSTILSRVISRDPYNLLALMLNGTVKLAKGDGPGAIAVFTTMPNLFKRVPRVQFLLAQAYLVNKDESKAIVSLNQAIAAEPGYAEAVLLLARLNIQRGDNSQAIAGLNDLIKREPQLGQAYFLLIDAYLGKKEDGLALSTCQTLANMYPASAQVQVLFGSLLARQNQVAEARHAFEKALSISPAYLGAVEQLVELDTAAGQLPAALQRVQQFIDKNPSEASAGWVLLGKIHIADAETAVRAANANNSVQSLGLNDVAAAQPAVHEAEQALLKASELDPNSRAPYLVLSGLYVTCGKQQQALTQLNTLLSKTNDAVALMRVGNIQQTLTNYSAAADAYNKVLELSPNYTAALNNLAYLYSEQLNKPDEAFKMADKARQLAPKDPSVVDTYGWLLYKRGEYTRALEALRQSASANPSDPEIQYHLGMVQYMLGNESAATDALRLAAGTKNQFSGKDVAQRALDVLAIDPKTANSSQRAEIERALQNNPKDPVALLRLGAVQEREGTLEKAVETYQMAQKYSPENSALALKLAQLYASPGINDPVKALAFAKNAHEISPDDARVSAFLGELVLGTGDYKWAASLLEDSARKLPEEPTVSYDLACAYYTVGRVNDAQTLLNKVTAAPNFGKANEARRFLALVSAASDPAQASASVADANAALQSDSNNVPALMVLAVASEAQKNYDKAAAAYNQVLSRRPLFTPATRSLGLLYFARLNDEQKAYDLLNKARDAFPQDAGVAKALGILTYKKGNYSRAAQLLKESSQTKNDDAELLYYLGMAQYQLKARPESKAALQKALNFELPSKLAEDAKRVLAELK